MPQNREHIFNHLIIFFELFHKDIRKWGAILIRNASTFRRVKCHFPTPQNGISPTEMPYRLLIDFGFLGFVYSNHRISVSFGSQTLIFFALKFITTLRNRKNYCQDESDWSVFDLSYLGQFCELDSDIFCIKINYDIPKPKKLILGRI